MLRQTLSMLFSACVVASSGEDMHIAVMSSGSIMCAVYARASQPALTK